MALSGTLDTLSLPELCELLSGTGKTGALHIRADAGQGVLWFNGGQVCAGEAGGQTGPPEPGGPDPVERLHDVCFELFRYHEGTFEFEAERRPSWPAEKSFDVTGLLVETERRMTEWREIIAVIPSIEARPRLVPEAPAGGPITLDASQWRVVTGIDGRRRVSALIRVLDGGEFSICKVLKSLVVAGLVEIDSTDSAASPSGAETPAATVVGSGPDGGARSAGRGGKDRGRGEANDDVTGDPAPERAGESDDPLADGLDRGAVVALLTSARTK
jgi:hypothetical protein